MGFDISKTVTTARPLSGVGRMTAYLASASVRTRRQLSSDRVGTGLGIGAAQGLDIGAHAPAVINQRPSIDAHTQGTDRHQPTIPCLGLAK